jgi:hypothetical protein
MRPTHAYEVRTRKDHRGVDLISDALPFGPLWYEGPNAVANAIGYAKRYSRSHDAVIRLSAFYEARTHLPLDSHIDAGGADRYAGAPRS